jgi:hypothetical protein
VSKLTKHHAQELFPATEILGLIVPIVAFYTPFEDIIRCKLHQLGEDHLALIHLKNFLQMKSKPSSNRRRHKNSANVEFQAFQRTFIKNNATLLFCNNLKPSNNSVSF